VCGNVSAIGLQEAERELWPVLRERLRVPGELMALMRGVLGDTEVGAVVSVTPQGVVTVRAILATPPAIADEIRLLDTGTDRPWLRRALVGEYEVEVVVGEWPDGRPRPLAILTTPWIEQHLLIYARTLWRRRVT
jgi:hypothetical protein